MSHVAIASSLPAIPRARWLRRIAIGIGALCAVALASRLVAGFVADRRDAAQLARLKGDGFATRMEDLAPPSVPDAANAAFVWRQAFAAMKNVTVDSPRNSIYDASTLGWFPPYTPRWHYLANSSAAANVGVFALAKRAAAMPRVDWQLNFQPGNAINVVTSGESSDARDLANRLSDEAERLFLLGDDAEGLGCIRSCLALATAFHAKPSILSELIADGMESVAIDALRRHVGTLEIGPHGVPVADVRAMIQGLCDIDASQRQFEHAMMSEVTFAIDFNQALVRPGSQWLVAPTLRLACRQSLETIADAATAARRPGASTQSAASNPRVPLVESTDPARRLLYWQLLMDSTDDSSRRVAKVDAQQRTRRAVMALALALRWYQCEHAGAVPPSLEALAPNYNAAVPRNAMAPHGEPFEYVVQHASLPGGGDRPLLFVAMPDGVRGSVSTLPEYDLYFQPPSIAGRWSDLTSWTPTAAQLRQAGK